MRAPARSLLVVTLLALLPSARGLYGQSRIDCGPGRATCGPAIVRVVGTTTTTLPTQSCLDHSQSVTTGYDINVPINLATSFYVTKPGCHLVGVALWKLVGNTGTHIATLWDAQTSTNLGSVTFTNETPSGWQIAMFPTPISLSSAANYYYRLSVSHTVQYSQQGWSGVDLPNLHCQATSYYTLSADPYAEPTTSNISWFGMDPIVDNLP